MTTATDETVTIPILSGIPTDAEVADALDAAAGVVHANGLHKGGYVDRWQENAGTPEAGCRVDAIGAINLAVTGCPVTWGGISHDQYLLCMAAVAAMQEQVNGGRVGIQTWSDRSTADDVEASFRAAATRVRGEGA